MLLLFLFSRKCDTFLDVYICSIFDVGCTLCAAPYTWVLSISMWKKNPNGWSRSKNTFEAIMWQYRRFVRVEKRNWDSPNEPLSLMFTLFNFMFLWSFQKNKNKSQIIFRAFLLTSLFVAPIEILWFLVLYFSNFNKPTRKLHIRTNTHTPKDIFDHNLVQSLFDCHFLELRFGFTQCWLNRLIRSCSKYLDDI